MQRYETERERNKDFLLKDGDYVSTKDVLERIAKIIPDKKILAELDANQNIIYHTSKDVKNDVDAIGEGLISIGLEGKHIAIAAENSYLYIMCDLAIAGGVGVVTPIDKDAPADLMATLLNKCDADAIIISAHLADKVKAAKANCPKLKTIITIDQKIEGLENLQELMAKGRVLAEKGYYRNKELDLDAPAKLLFTSGTTGANKGVILSQNNLAANIMNCMEMKCEEDELNTSMSVLPMHHATEINTHIFIRIACGRLTYINDNMKNMMTNMRIFKPHVITIVPMIANAFYRTIWMNVRKMGMEMQLKQAILMSNNLRQNGIDKTHEIFKDVLAPFGGNLRQIVCGGAMLNPEVVKGFNDFGVFIVNGYGITECGPLISMNTETMTEPYSVGRPNAVLEVKLIDQSADGIGELCVKGKSVSKGYYKDPEATAKVFDKDGFFHTGDMARIDEQGRIFLAGRQKNLIVLANGKNIYPEELEHEISIRLPYVKENVVYMAEFENACGKLQEGICAGVVVEEEMLSNLEKIKEDFRTLNRELPNHKKIAYILLQTQEYEKTSSKKIKRTTIMDRHNTKTGLMI